MRETHAQCVRVGRSEQCADRNVLPIQAQDDDRKGFLDSARLHVGKLFFAGLWMADNSHRSEHIDQAMSQESLSVNSYACIPLSSVYFLRAVLKI